MVAGRSQIVESGGGLRRVQAEATGVSSSHPHLAYGTLPAIAKEKGATHQESDLRSYVETYLEEEVREEALVRSLGIFARFLELAALESGRVSNFSRIASEIGVSPQTIQSYYEILEDCLIAERVDPIVRSVSRKKLTKASRFLFFDLGVRRLSAEEGIKPTPERLSELFEQYVGLKLIRLCRLTSQGLSVRFWRDPDGPEVDWVIENSGEFVPIEVKWSTRPTAKDARHLEVFLDEYKARKGFIICRAPEPLRITDRVTAIAWTAIKIPWLKKLFVR